LASLSHLSRHPIDSIKIDRSFVHQLRRNSADSVVVAAIVQLGSTLRKAVVTEGIESADQVAQLLERGCELGQGCPSRPPGRPSFPPRIRLRRSVSGRPLGG